MQKFSSDGLDGGLGALVVTRHVGVHGWRHWSARRIAYCGAGDLWSLASCAPAALLSRHPHLVFDVSFEDIRTDLIGAGIDVALRIGGEDDPNEVVRKLGATRVRLVGATRYFETHGIPRHPLDLAHHACLMYARGASIPWLFSGPEGVFDVPIAGRLKSDNVDALRVAVTAGSGLAARRHH